MSASIVCLQTSYIHTSIHTYIHTILHASIVCLLLHHPCWGKASVGKAMPEWHALLSVAFTWVRVSYLGWLASMALRPPAEQLGASTKEKLADPKARQTNCHIYIRSCCMTLDTLTYEMPLLVSRVCCAGLHAAASAKSLMPSLSRRTIDRPPANCSHAKSLMPNIQPSSSSFSSSSCPSLFHDHACLFPLHALLFPFLFAYVPKRAGSLMDLRIVLLVVGICGGALPPAPPCIIMQIALGPGIAAGDIAKGALVHKQACNAPCT